MDLRIQGNEKWKTRPSSPNYDSKLIQARLLHLQALAMKDDPSSAMFLLRAGLIRNLGGICNPKLYRTCHLGTKHLIEEYVAEVVRQLRYIAAYPLLEMPISARVDFFSELLQSFGRSALILHGGASFGLCHLGVARALNDAGMLPKIVCGSYIGALAASLICCYDKEGLERVLDGHINLQAFSRHSPQGSWRRRIVRLLKHGRLFDVRVLEECARQNIGDLTFREAYIKSGRLLNIIVHAKRKHEVPVLLNYISAPDVLVWSAACASCAVPGIYDSVTLMAKAADGTVGPWNPSAIRFESASVSQEMPISRLSEMFNANNFIVSQVPSYFTIQYSLGDRPSRTWKGAMMRFVFAEIAHRLYQLHELGLLPTRLQKLGRFISARVEGDVHISPSIRFSDIHHILTTPTPEFVHDCIEKGRRAAWRRLANIEMRCAVEFAIEEIKHKLKRSVDHAGDAAGDAEASAGAGPGDGWNRKRCHTLHL